MVLGFFFEFFAFYCGQSEQLHFLLVFVSTQVKSGQSLLATKERRNRRENYKWNTWFHVFCEFFAFYCGQSELLRFLLVFVSTQVKSGQYLLAAKERKEHKEKQRRVILESGSLRA
jgi:hypothetical protein